MKSIPSAGRRTALVAALLGWMFDGLEIGLFPLVARPALRDLLQAGAPESLVGLWFGIITAGFLVGAAAGGVLFGRLGDRIGRVRAMTLSVLVYAGCSGLGGLAQTPQQLAALRFLGALGMGGEWALGVALVMELYADKSRGVLAAWIGAAGNLGYGLVALIYFAINRLPQLEGTGTANWRLLMLAGALPAAFTLFLRFFVPESPKWEAERDRGAASQWSPWDLAWVLFGTAVACGMVAVWALPVHRFWQFAALVPGVGVSAWAMLQPTRHFLIRSGTEETARRRITGRMLLGAGLAGVPLLGTWAGVMWQYNFVDRLTGGTNPDARPTVMLASSLGAAAGSFLLALLGDRFGRRILYAIACIISMFTLYGFYTYNTVYGPLFVAGSFALGFVCASFYGWLPLYLPELFPTAIRATAQGFAYNFGRIIAAVGALQMTAILAAFDDDYSRACAVSAGIFLMGLVLIAVAPETRGEELPS